MQGEDCCCKSLWQVVKVQHVCQHNPARFPKTWPPKGVEVVGCNLLTVSFIFASITLQTSVLVERSDKVAASYQTHFMTVHSIATNVRAMAFRKTGSDRPQRKWSDESEGSDGSLCCEPGPPDSDQHVAIEFGCTAFWLFSKVTYSTPMTNVN